MTWLQENSLPFLITAVLGVFFIGAFYAIREQKILLRKNICYANFSNYKQRYNVKANKALSIIGFAFIAYCLVLAVISATSNVLKINLTVYLSSLLILVVLVIGNYRLPSHNKSLTSFENQYEFIQSYQKQLNSLGKTIDDSAREFEKSCDRIEKTVNSNELARIVEYNHSYIEEQKKLVAEKILEAKSYASVSQKALIENFDSEIYNYIHFGQLSALEQIDVTGVIQSLIEAVNGAYVSILNYVKEETCKQLDIEDKIYFKLFGSFNVFNNKATDVECMYVVLKNNNSTKASVHSLCSLEGRKLIISEYEKLQQNNVTLTNSLLKMIFIYKKNVVSSFNYFDYEEMLNYYLQLKSNCEYDSLRTLLKLLALVILEVNMDSSVFNSTIAILQECFNCPYGKNDLKKEICSKEVLPKLARVVGHIEIERCTLDRILSI